VLDERMLAPYLDEALLGGVQEIEGGAGSRVEARELQVEAVR